MMKFIELESKRQKDESTQRQSHSYLKPDGDADFQYRKEKVKLLQLHQDSLVAETEIKTKQLQQQSLVDRREKEMVMMVDRDQLSANKEEVLQMMKNRKYGGGLQFGQTSVQKSVLRQDPITGAYYSADPRSEEIEVKDIQRNSKIKA